MTKLYNSYYIQNKLLIYLYFIILLLNVYRAYLMYNLDKSESFYINENYILKNEIKNERKKQLEASALVGGNCVFLHLLHIFRRCFATVLQIFSIFQFAFQHRASYFLQIYVSYAAKMKILF